MTMQAIAADHTRRQRPHGFTLIELVVVIAVIGVIGVCIAGPTLSYVSTMRTRGAAARIACDLRYIQRWAIATRNRTWMVVDANSNSYSLYVENPSNPGRGGRVTLARALEGVALSVKVDLPPFTGVSVSSVNSGGTSEIEFDSWGVPYNASDVALTSAAQIVLTGPVTITVQPVTGLAEVSG